MTGCAAEQSAMPPVITQRPVSGASAALVFDVPITLTEPEVNISRDDRGQAALVGYEEGSVSNYSIVTDNRQTDDGSDDYVKESVTVRNGATHH